MARSTFGGTLADTVAVISGGFFAVASGSITFWSAKTGGTKYTDLVYNGQAASSIPATNSQIPQFQGPDGVTQMWADGGGGARLLIVAPGTSSGGPSEIDDVSGLPEALTALGETAAAGGEVAEDVTNEQMPFKDNAGDWVGKDVTPVGLDLLAANDAAAAQDAIELVGTVTAVDASRDPIAGLKLVQGGSPADPSEIGLIDAGTLLEAIIFEQQGDIIVGGPSGDSVERLPKGNYGDVFHVEDRDSYGTNIFDLKWHRPPIRRTPVGGFAVPNFIQSHTAGTPTSGRQYFQEVELGPGQYDGIQINVTTARVGGAATFYVALYDMDDDGFPDTANGPLLNGTIVLTATGTPVMTDANPVDLLGGAYFVSSLYVQTSAPSTVPQLLCANATTNPGPVSVVDSTHIGTVNDAWGRNGVTGLVTDVTDFSNLGIYNTNNIPILGVRRSA